jgi:Flp pilus assembly protein CpaB
MNRESSRSHSVFTLTLESRDDGLERLAEANTARRVAVALRSAHLFKLGKDYPVFP